MTSGYSVPSMLQVAAERVRNRRSGERDDLLVYTSTTAEDADLLRLGVQRAYVSFVAGSPGQSPAELREALSDSGLEPEFVGTTPSDGAVWPVAVFRGLKPPRLLEPPESFRVTAVIVAYNEADVIGATTRHLVQQGLGIYLVDNWSTDNTGEIAKAAAGQSLVGFERFPRSAPSSTFDLADQLRRVEQIALELGPHWVVSNDADEIRVSPWPDVSLRDSLYHVESEGFSAVNYSTLNFALTSHEDHGSPDFMSTLRYFEPQRTPGCNQVNTWHQVEGMRVDLATSGRHSAIFPGRAIFPFNFLMKHYPIRSVEQGIRKINAERLPRYRTDEKLSGWHGHYRPVKAPERLIRNPGELVRFDETFESIFLLERLTGAGFDVLPTGPTLRLRSARFLRRLRMLDAARRLKWRVHGSRAKSL